MLNGNEAIHAKNRWKTEASQLSDADWYKQFISFNYMKKVVGELKILAPMMDEFNTENPKQIKVLKKCLKEIKWYQLLYEIYTTLETKGEFFAYWNDNEENKVNGIPNIIVLESQNFINIERDPYTKQPVKYAYRDNIEDVVINDITGDISTINNRQRTMIFERGKITIYDPVKFSDPNLYPEGQAIFWNKAEYSDMIRLIHITSFKEFNQIFCDIPAEQYIDPCLLLSKIDTNRDIINDHMGFPFPYIIGGYINASKSSLIAGGCAVIEPEEWAKTMGQMPQVIKMEINNDLQSIKDEKADVVSDLYKKVCLIRESLEEILSGSSSSRNISQLRLGIEEKNRKYYTNIAEGLRDYFKVVLIENGVWNKTNESNITLVVPDILINNSYFDDLLMIQQKRALGKSTLKKEMIAEGATEAEVQARQDQISEEMYKKGEDMSFATKAVTNTVANSNATEFEKVPIVNDTKTKTKKVKTNATPGNPNGVQGLDNNFKKNK